MKIRWLDKAKFTVGAEIFQAISNLDQMYEFNSSDGYVFSKTKKMIDRYDSYLGGEDINNIFEIGVFRGGSVIFFCEYFNPKKMVAIDFQLECVDLDNYIKKRSLESKVIPYYSTNQADSHKLNDIIAKEFGDELLDIVIDDASHFLEETRASFNTLFPKLKPGGIYVIEDWQWVHSQHKSLLENFKNKSPLTNIIFEIIMTCGSAANIIDEIVVTDNLCFIRRGVGYIDSKTFDIANSFYFRGEKQNKVDYFSALEKRSVNLFSRFNKCK